MLIKTIFCNIWWLIEFRHKLSHVCKFDSLCVSQIWYYNIEIYTGVYIMCHVFVASIFTLSYYNLITDVSKSLNDVLIWSEIGADLITFLIYGEDWNKVWSTINTLYLAVYLLTSSSTYDHTSFAMYNKQLYLLNKYPIL